MRIRSVRELAAVIRDRRKRSGITQAQLATQCGVSRDWVIQFEKGASGVEIGLVFRALNALGLSLEIETSATASQGTKGTIDQILTDLTRKDAP